MIELKHLTKTFSLAGSSGNDITKVDALKDVSLTIHDGEIYGIIGMSGAGKSTLVRCINMLERPTDGQVLIDGQNIGLCSAKELRSIRRNITMIFQNFNLLMQRNCLSNICFPLELSGVSKKEARQRAMQLLETVGLPDKAGAYPAQLSGGQQQRIAIARALATEPKVLLCDEATSALDPGTTHQILDLLKKINREMGITIIVITHQMSVVEEVCNRVAILDNGRVVEEGEVGRIFANPHSDAAKRLVFPGNSAKSDRETDTSTPEIPATASPNEKVIRVVFNGAHAADKPIITQMAVDIRIAANILYASTRCIGEKVYGNMLLGISGDGKVLEDAITYLTRDEDIRVEILDRTVGGNTSV